MKNLIALILIGIVAFACNQTSKVLTENGALSNDKSSIDLYSIDGKNATVYTTASNTDLRLQKTNTLSFGNKTQASESEISVFVNPDKKFQSFLGIGGAITDASAEVFDQLPSDKQEELLTAYYDVEKGIGYSLCRTPIHSCDFSSESYTYIEEGDKELKTFDIAHDKVHKIPLIKKATKAAGGELMLYASPWSPPAFMKDNNNVLKGGKLLPEYFDAWALYYTKFIKAYEAEGMPIWGITIQNEPMAVQTWESCVYTAEEERDFLKNHLGPIMAREGLADKKIVVWDHNRDMIVNRANVIFGDPEASKYAWGIGFHWYEKWAGGTSLFTNLGMVKESFPTKNLLFTEGCQEVFDANKYFNWEHAERYGRSMINDFNQGTVGWTDWNILLDQTGGPNHVGNLCFAPIHGDLDKGELIYTPSYYYIGHFSKFIRPEARRVSCSSSISYLLSTAFLNMDNSLVIVVMNEHNENINYKIVIGPNTLNLSIPRHAMQSIVIK